MSPQPFGNRWEIKPQPLSRLDYIATAIYAAYMANPAIDNRDVTYDDAVYHAKGLIAELDKEQTS